LKNKIRCFGTVLAFFIVASTWAQETQRRSTADLDALLAEIPGVANEGLDGVGPNVQRLAKAIQAHGARAVPAMIKLLSADDNNARLFAGYVLRDLDGVTEANLDALIAARRRGDGWIAPAIGRIGSPRAVAFLIEDLKAKPEEGQTSWALVTAGEKAAPALVELYRDKKPIPGDLFRVSSQVLHEIGTKATLAVEPLLATASDANAIPENRIFAVLALGALRQTAASAVPGLKALAKADPARFKQPVEAALVKIGTEESTEVIVMRLRARPSVLLLRDISELRVNGRGAGPAVVELLDHPDWEIRVAAARTIGYIGYAEGVDPLRRLLGNTTDWRLVYSAAESLGRLKAQSALPGLNRVAADHWFPPVRKAAEKASSVIAGKQDYVSRWHADNFPFEFFEYQSVRDERFDGYATYEKLPWKTEVELLTRDQLRAESYTVEIVGYDEKGKHVHRREATPRCGIHLPEGLLLGGDRGEWGGELAFRAKAGVVTTLVEDNTSGIHRMPFGVVALTGLAHLSLNHGYIYLIEFKEGSPPNARLWKVLPGAPTKSGLLKSGELFIACVGGNVLISPTGDISMASPAMGEKASR
jgi:HEAT repeat protein